LLREGGLGGLMGENPKPEVKGGGGDPKTLGVGVPVSHKGGLWKTEVGPT